MQKQLAIILLGAFLTMFSNLSTHSIGEEPAKDNSRISATPEAGK